MLARLYEIAPASAIEAARTNSEAMGRELAAAGITVNYHAPFDVRRAETDSVIGDRALGSDPMQVAALGRAVLEGLARAGVAGCLKHMPGHGRATADSHRELPVVTASSVELEPDIEPFRTLADRAAIGMSAHIRFTAWDSENPATLSSYVIEEIIRKRIGFHGLLLTDDIDMKALDGTIPQRAGNALTAGCDVVLNCWAKIFDMTEMAQSLPPLSEKAGERLEAALAGTELANQDEDLAELLAKRDNLLALVEKTV